MYGGHYTIVVITGGDDTKYMIYILIVGCEGFSVPYMR